MTKKLFIVCAALVWTVALVAQNISVVAANGSTKLYRTLQAAIEGADPNSTIYLPGGSFSIDDSVKITKKLTIIGIGHYVMSDNVDGSSKIKGNLFFNQGSSGSAVMGCYITGNVYIGQGGNSVNDILVKYCNLNAVSVLNSTCQETIIDQNYIRGYPSCTGTQATIKNNIMTGITSFSDGIIKNNILTAGGGMNYGSVVGSITFDNVHNCTIINNILLTKGYIEPNDNYNGHRMNSNNEVYNNMRLNNSWGNDATNINNTDVSWNDVFVNYNGGAISPDSDFHFKDDYKQYENQVGIYAGDGFNDKQLAPVPYIVAKKIDEQTDAAGKLNIKIRVKASGEE